MKFAQWINFFNQLCPPTAIYENDNVGRQVGHSNKVIKKIMLCLDCNNLAIKRAIQTKVDLIVSFHPLFYPNRRKSCLIPRKKAQYLMLKQHKIAVFSMHTNYENLYLSRFLLEKFTKTSIISKNLISTTTLAKPTPLKKLVEKCKKIFNIQQLDYWVKQDDWTQTIKTITLISGSGGHALKTIKEWKADLLITGDLKWNHWQIILEEQQNTLVVGHHMEEFFIEMLTKQIQQSQFAQTCTLTAYWQGSIFKKI